MPKIKSIAGFYASCQFQVGQEDISMPSGFQVLQFQKCGLQMFNFVLMLNEFLQDGRYFGEWKNSMSICHRWQQKSRLFVVTFSFKVPLYEILEL